MNSSKQSFLDKVKEQMSKIEEIAEVAAADGDEHLMGKLRGFTFCFKG